MWTLVIFVIVSAIVASPVTSIQVDESDVRIFLYTRTETDGVEVFLSNVTSVSSSPFNSTKETVFDTHGWTKSYQSPSCVDVKNAYLEAADVNMFLVDWKTIAALDYVDAKLRVPAVGTVLANLVESLVSTGGLDLEKTSMVGHSLGAHVVGVAGKVLGGQLKAIVGLDPAGPLYTVDVTDNRLNKGDAGFVQVIHTCAGRLGFLATIGDADYWPNGGKSQPGCLLDLTGICDHKRAFLYFSESLISGNFTSYPCDNYDEFEAGNCTDSSSYMGELNLDTTASGNYFLYTNSESPYAEG